MENLLCHLLDHSVCERSEQWNLRGGGGKFFKKVILREDEVIFGVFLEGWGLGWSGKRW